MNCSRPTGRSEQQLKQWGVRMKKWISLILALTMLSTFAGAVDEAAAGAPGEGTVPVDDTTPLLLTYAEIERLILENNPVIFQNRASLYALEHNDATNSMADALWEMSSQLSAMQRRLDGAAEALENASASTPEIQGIYGALALNLRASSALVSSTISTVKAQSAQMNVSEDTIKTTKLNMEQAELQLVSGAQNIFIAYNAMARQVRDLARSRTYLEHNIEIMELRLKLGQISELDLLSVTGQLPQVISGIATLENEMENLRGEMNLMLGRAFDAPLEFAPLPAAVLPEAEKRGENQKKALENSYSLKLKEQALKEIKNPNDSQAIEKQRQAAVSARDAEARRVLFLEDKLWRALEDKQRAAADAQSALQDEARRYDAAKLKYELGTIARIDFEKAQLDYETKASAVQSAYGDIFTAALQYDWLIRGLPAQ